MLGSSPQRYVHARPLPGTGLDAVPSVWLPVHTRIGHETIPLGGVRTWVKPRVQDHAALPLRLSLPSTRVAEATGPVAACPTPASASDDGRKLARLEEELRCARSELKALQVELLEEKKRPKAQECPERQTPSPVPSPGAFEGVMLEWDQPHRQTEAAAAQEAAGDPLAALAAVWARVEAPETGADNVAGPQPEASSVRPTAETAEVPSTVEVEASVNFVERSEATANEFAEASPEAWEVGAVDPEVLEEPSSAGQADVSLHAEPLSEELRPVPTADEQAASCFDNEEVEENPDIAPEEEDDADLRPASSPEDPEEDVDVSDVSDQTVPQDPSENVEHLPEEVDVEVAASSSSEVDGPLVLESPSEAGSNSAWVSTAAPNPLASSEDEEDAAAAATSGDEDPEAGASTARVSTQAPFPSRMMTDIASSESELQVDSSSNEAAVAEPQEPCEGGASSWEAAASWPSQAADPWPEAPAGQWPAFASQVNQDAAQGSEAQATWQAPDLERLAASVEKFNEEMRSKWFVLDDLTQRLSQVEHSLRSASAAKMEQLERRVEKLERQLEAEPEPSAPSQDRGQHQVWL